VSRDGSTRRPRRNPAETGPNDPRFPLVVEFGRGRATPRIESVAALHRCGQWLSRRGAERVSVVGHANKRVSERAAAALARERVAAVTSLLVVFGASSAQLVAIATPRLHSVWLGSTRIDRLQRRVVVVFRHEPPRAQQRRERWPARGGNGARRPVRERAVTA
jgi:outer membrane protein OmpA-like peptidoglycan-associated protein